MKNFLQKKNVNSGALDWPGNTLDPNPIENSWYVLKNQVEDQHPTSMESLKTEIKIVWTQKMTSEHCCNLIDSQPHRIVAVVKNREGLTKY